MARRGRLLNRHLEDISWRAVEEYPAVVRDLIRRRAGVYVLYRSRSLYYVGLASNLMGRLKGHVRDRHRGLWDRFSVYLTTDHDHMKELESLILRMVRPSGNKVSGHFAGSDNLRDRVNRLMREVDADRRAVILGGHVAARRRRLKASKPKGPRALAGISEKSIPLRASYGRRRYRARLRKDETILYARRRFQSPSAAGHAVVRGPCNGWTFWHYRDQSGRWVPLASMRK